MHFDISATEPAPPTPLPSVLNISTQMSQSSTACQEKAGKEEYYPILPLLPSIFASALEVHYFHSHFANTGTCVVKEALTRVKHADTSSLLKGKSSSMWFRFPQWGAWEGHFFRKQLTSHCQSAQILPVPPAYALRLLLALLVPFPWHPQLLLPRTISFHSKVYSGMIFNKLH